MHYGIKGQKWGVRRYQNADGSLTTAGRARYSKGSGKTKYGSAYNALDVAKEKKVAKLNKKIDRTNLAYQMGLAKRDAESNSPLATRWNEKMNASDQRKLAKLVAKRNALDPSQANRQGRLLTNDEYNKYYNVGKNSTAAQLAFGLPGAAINAIVGSRSKKTHDAEYENYRKNAVTYGKKPKYGSAYNALDVAKEKKVAKLNKKIDRTNLAYQMGLAKRDAESNSPLATRWNEKMNASDQRKLAKLVAKRNALDPSQANRQGRLLTNDEYNKYYNVGKNSTAAQLAFGLPGAAINAIVGSRSKKTHDAEYENYKNNAVSYGSKKKKAESSNSKISADTNGVWDSKSAPGVYKSIAKYDWSTGVYNSKDAPPELKKAALKRQRMLQKAYLNGDFDNIDDSYDDVVDVYPDQKYMKKWEKFVSKNPTAFNPPF